jgi:hypothetical protein
MYMYIVIIWRLEGFRPEGRYQSRADDKGNMKKGMY